ncbi:Ectonucleoside triphosphate diphosphohydrolase 2,related [Neospora caninum Liverpool]|uniref:Ectonucleoside triphosphate diphosphohydrolase 2,related n=1 Tax=Neospora caninum (strain Liverpool) TaxID=572307 RepID=F0VPI4_NEOCL|nr:Ectonucleoside triphosphate diphosphohydrolase 2,related [Neospora caninum Liverpool]CBZ55630.1 Ectonucleoside triphosphate diphosphohydrolase 2,related [Neospora caninum Liverpool]CEL70372.1 TPA: Ectonucleoside triphosphate diphosphohydrolase 2,related [Neospora caninum Liverpool]|eukprot:XP_003885658.1 Ectonucleoside triphosphate diphosphohydrolase 2,related [Neospora caninum Liverpool]
MANAEHEVGAYPHAPAEPEREHEAPRHPRTSSASLPASRCSSSPSGAAWPACSAAAMSSDPASGGYRYESVPSAQRNRYHLPASRPLLSDCAGGASDAQLQRPFHSCYFDAPERATAPDSVPWTSTRRVWAALWKQLFWWLLAPLLFVFLWLVWSATTSFYFSRRTQLDYGIVIDAGSHGSRLTVFSWEVRRFDPRHPLTGPVTIPQPVCEGVPAPALSSFADDFTGARQAFKAMLDESQACLARRGVSASVWGEIPLFVKATGGMRNLSQGTRDALMANLRTVLEDPSLNPFKFCPSWARVISGEEEGVYGWLSVNSVRGSLSDDPEKTVGALDMGGASMQITFSPLHTSVLEDFIGVHLGNKSIRLYSHSFLGYGWSDALNRVSTMLGVEALIERLQEDPTFIEKASKRSLLPDATYLDSSLGSAAQRSSRGRADTTSEAKHPQGPGEKKDQPKRPEDHTDDQREVTLASVHPCLPRGSVRAFRMPSLAYPERRFYVDIDVNQITAFMKAASYAKNDILKTVKSMAPYGVKMRHTLQDMQPLSSILSKAAPLDFNASAHDAVSDGAATLETPDREGVVASVEDGAREGGRGKGEHSASPPREKEGVRRNKQSGLNSESQKDQQRGEKERNKEKGQSMESAEGAVNEAKPTTKENVVGTGKQGGVEITLDVKPKVTFVVRFVGSGDFKACRERAYKLFHNSLCFINSCSFNGVYQPRLENSKFIAFGQFSKVHAALRLTNPTSLSEFLTATTAICSLRLGRLKRLMRRGVFRAFADLSLHKLCWKAIWSFAALRQGFGFPLESSQVSFATLNNTNSENSYVAPGWTLGSMISEVNVFPWQAPVEQYHGLFHLAAAFLLMCIILAMILYHEVSFLRKRLEKAERAQLQDSIFGTTEPPTPVGCPLHPIGSAPA